ncbi:MAG TPA: hypothetical protein VFS76_04615 [Pyrinomonadaceae bacterium]|nr:hypothetical protein [Pyrinomonadaceae bacterium]
MRVEVINVNKFARVRRTFRPGWRSFIILIFLLVVFFWWAMFNGLPHVNQIAQNEHLQLQLLVIGIVLLPILGIACFTKKGFARFTFAVIACFSLPELDLAIL